MNAKIYEYDTKVYRTKITITAIFCAYILAYVHCLVVVTTNVPALWVVAAVVAGSFVWETFSIDSQSVKS